MNARRWLTATIAICALFVMAVHADTIVAEINGQKINRDEYVMELERVPIPVGTDTIGKPVTVQAGYVALRNIIDRSLILEMAKKENLLPTKQQLDTEMARVKIKKDFSSTLQELGYTEDDYRDDLNVELCKFNLRTKGITVTEEEVKKFYTSKLKDISTPEAVKIQMIQCNTEDAAKAVMEALKTVDFGQIARENSIHPSRDDDGIIADWMTATSWPDAVWPQIWTSLPNTPVGPITLDGPVSTDGSNTPVKIYIVVKVLERRQRVEPSFESVKEDMTKMLMLSKSKRDLDKDLAKMRISSKIKITMPRFDKAWQDAMKAAKGK